MMTYLMSLVADTAKDTITVPVFTDKQIQSEHTILSLLILQLIYVISIKSPDGILPLVLLFKLILILFHGTIHFQNICHTI